MKKASFTKDMKLLLHSVIILLFFGGHFNTPVFAQVNDQQSYTEFKGLVMDSNTKKPLVFADINVNESNISTITNTEGEFALKVPNGHTNQSITISFLGFEKKTILLSNLRKSKNKIYLNELVTQLSEVSINIPKDAETLVRETLKRKGTNYISDQAIMTAFYRETIKKRNKNASLSEAVVEIYKQPYASNKKDNVKLIKARKKTNYSRLDTLALKLQGGPFSTLYVDIIKYPQFIFNDNNLSNYEFSFDNATQINDNKVYVVKFKQKPQVDFPLYYGKLFIDANTFSLVSAIYNLNVENRALASQLFIRKKPNKVKVYPTEAAYRVDYRTTDGKWYYGYSNLQLTFKVNWKGKLFNSTYSLSSEMAITDWEFNTSGINRPKDGLKSTVILSDEASGFSDPEFWGEYNIIEPEKSIESAIRKINKQLKRTEP